MRNVLVVVVTFAFCAVVVTTATWVINRWERRRSTGSRPPDVRHRVDGGRGNFARANPAVDATSFVLRRTNRCDVTTCGYAMRPNRREGR